MFASNVIVIHTSNADGTSALTTPEHADRSKDMSEDMSVVKSMKFHSSCSTYLHTYLLHILYVPSMFRQRTETRVELHIPDFALKSM